MGRYTVNRLIQMIPVLFFLSIFIFLVVRVLPGDPIRIILGPDADATMTPAERAALEESLGLDRPLFFQYVDWVGKVLRGDWGRSFLSREQISEMVGTRMMVTGQLAAVSWLLAVGVGVPIGIFSALKRNTWPDTMVNIFALAGVATPNFLLGLILIVVFSVYLGLLPTYGYVSLFDDPVEGLRHLALPAFALATSLMTTLIRQTRSAMLEVMNEDYIRTARAKGLSQARVVTRHALKNALLPVVTVAAIQVGNLVSGTVIIETMFSIPGMGRLTINGVYTNDYALVQIVILLFAVAVMSANLIADLLYVKLDPRIQLG